MSLEIILYLQESRNGTESSRAPCITIFHNQGTTIKAEKLTLGQYYCPGVRKLGSQALAAHGLFSCLRLCWNAATPHSFTYRLSFQFQWRGQVVSKETTWLTKPKIFTTKYWLFIGKKKSHHFLFLRKLHTFFKFPQFSTDALFPLQDAARH